MSSYHNRTLTLLLWGAFSLTLISCASTPPKPYGSAPAISRPATAPTPAAGGVYHTVQNGETLWRISKIYNVPVDVIKQANRLVSDTVNAGNRLFIPAVTGIGVLADATVAQAGRVLVPASSTPVATCPGGCGGNFLWPVRGRVLTRFGVTVNDVTTKGIDIASALNQPVAASKSGTVSFVSESVKGYGKMIIIDHSNSFQTVYAYNNQILVTKGQRVAQGQKIAESGISSRDQQPSLHFEIRRAHEPINPEPLLR